MKDNGMDGACGMHGILEILVQNFLSGQLEGKIGIK
jgi:hypothetical protein